MKNSRQPAGSARIRGIAGAVLPVLVTTLSRQRWVSASPVFLLGTTITAVGTTIAKNDLTIFVGMVIIGLGVVAMWVAETGRPRVGTIPGPLVFIGGSVLTALSLSLVPSNPLLCLGMILTGAGTIAMWVVWIGGWTGGTFLVGVLFAAGIITEALGLTVVPSDVMILAGMIATGLGAFAMWAYETTTEQEERKSQQEIIPKPEGNPKSSGL
jgi:hypothetical protein